MSSLGNKEIMAQNIKYYMNLHNKTQKEICRDLGIAETTFSGWVRAITYPRIDKIEKMANYFGIEKAYLVEDRSTLKAVLPVYRIPIVGKVVAGTPIDAIENITDYIRVTNPAAADGSYYALHVTGASMEPEMKEGDLVIVHKQDYFDSGDICIVLVNGNEATVKKVQKNDSGITLIGFNAMVYPPHFYNAHEVESLPVRIIGKVEEIRRKY